MLAIVTCPQWGARPPREPITVVGRAERIIFHHTAGHHAEITNPADESLAESVRYARDIQRFHMDTNGWIDSGHNFLVCRNGIVLQGRWLTVSAIQAGHMVRSAHCPGENTQIGIEHEHLGTEQMTDRQVEASARLMCWIAQRYHLTTVLPVAPHSAFFATECPANLRSDIARIRARAQALLVTG